jgi:hypothetical protein
MSRLPPPFSQLLAGVRWGVAGALMAGGTWAYWLAIPQSQLPQALTTIDPATAALTTGAGLACGFLLGTLTGTRSGMPVAGALGGALFGGFGGLIPLLAAATRGVLPVWLSSTLAWAALGFATGAVGSCGCRGPKPIDVIDDADDTRTRRAGPRVHAAWGGRGFGPISRLLPVVGVSVACLAAVVAGTPSPVGWVMLAVGVLGLAVAWALASQEKRIRELERLLSERDGRACGGREAASGFCRGATSPRSASSSRTPRPPAS